MRVAAFISSTISGEADCYEINRKGFESLFYTNGGCRICVRLSMCAELIVVYLEELLAL